MGLTETVLLYNKFKLNCMKNQWQCFVTFNDKVDEGHKYGFYISVVRNNWFLFWLLCMTRNFPCSVYLKSIWKISSYCTLNEAELSSIRTLFYLLLGRKEKILLLALILKKVEFIHIFLNRLLLIYFADFRLVAQKLSFNCILALNRLQFIFIRIKD